MAVHGVRGARSGAPLEARSVRRLGAALVGVALIAAAVWSAFGSGPVGDGPLAAREAPPDRQPREPLRLVDAAVDAAGDAAGDADTLPPAAEPAIVRREVDLASARGDPDSSLPEVGLVELVENLRSDDVRFNALRAVADLRAAGTAAVPLLEGALLSRDLQQRQLAGSVLRDRQSAPLFALIEVSVEALRRDLPRDLHKDFALATEATRYLAAHAAEARRELARGLGSNDEQQRFLCAFILAQSGCGDWIGHTCPILIEHLRDNLIEGDAMLSAHGLYRLGPAALPFVRAARWRADHQARQLLDLIELDIVEPPRTRDEIVARRAMHDITSIYHDPAFELDVQRARIATW